MGRSNRFEIGSRTRTQHFKARYHAAAGPHLVLPDRLRFVRLVGARLGCCWRHHRPPHRSLHRLHWYLRFPRLVVEARRAVRTTTCERRPTRTNDIVTKMESISPLGAHSIFGSSLE